MRPSPGAAGLWRRDQRSICAAPSSPFWYEDTSQAGAACPPGTHARPCRGSCAAHLLRGTKAVWGGAQALWPPSTALCRSGSCVAGSWDTSSGLELPGSLASGRRKQVGVEMSSKTGRVRVSDGASLVAQWLRICLLMQGTRVRALVWEDPTCRGATRPVSHNC